MSSTGDTLDSGSTGDTAVDVFQSWLKASPELQGSWPGWFQFQLWTCSVTGGQRGSPRVKVDQSESRTHVE